MGWRAASWRRLGRWHEGGRRSCRSLRWRTMVGCHVGVNAKQSAAAASSCSYSLLLFCVLLLPSKAMEFEGGSSSRSGSCKEKRKRSSILPSSNKKRSKSERKRRRHHCKRSKNECPMNRKPKLKESTPTDPDPEMERRANNCSWFARLWLRELALKRVGVKQRQSFLARLLLFRDNDLTSRDRDFLLDKVHGGRILGPDHINRNAEAALAYYNKQHPNAEFELVELLFETSVFDVGGFWFHLNFVAKPKNASSNDSLLKLFFAELRYADDSQVGKYELFCKCCCILDPNSPEDATTVCTWCKMRGNEIFHPAGSFTQASFILGDDGDSFYFPKEADSMYHEKKK